MKSVELGVVHAGLEKTNPFALSIPELLPARNQKALHEVPEATKATLQSVFLETVDDAIEASLGPRISEIMPLGVQAA